MNDDCKLLTVAYGHIHSGVWMSLRSDNVSEDAIEVMEGYSAGPYATKAYNLLKTSGRYDVVVQAGWLNNRYHDFIENMNSVGIRVVFDRDYLPPKLNSYRVTT